MSREKKLVVDRTDVLKFQDLDTDKNGSISQKEILDRFDEDHNGEISKKEYNSYNVSQKKKKRKSKHRRHGHGVNWYLWNVYKTTQLLSIPVFLLFYGLFYSVTTSVVLDSGLNENMNMFSVHEVTRTEQNQRHLPPEPPEPPPPSSGGCWSEFISEFLNDFS